MIAKKNRGGAGHGAAISGADEVPAPSRAIRDVRLSQGLSLRALSARAGLPYSTLSKLENGKMTLTYDKLIRLAQALNVDIKDLLANAQERAAPVAVGRRSVTRAGEALDADSEKHVHHYPAVDLLGKMMTPIIIDVQARSVDELGGLVRHGGEEYLYVLSGYGASLRPLCAAAALSGRLCLFRQRHGPWLRSHQQRTVHRSGGLRGPGDPAAGGNSAKAAALVRTAGRPLHLVFHYLKLQFQSLWLSHGNND